MREFTTSDTCVNFGAGHDVSFLKTKHLSHILRFVCIDALPRVPHYDKGMRGYDDNKDESSFLAALDRELRKRRAVRKVHESANHVRYVLGRDERRILDYYFNTTVLDALGQAELAELIAEAGTIIHKGFDPYGAGLRIATHMPNLQWEWTGRYLMDRKWWHKDEEEEEEEEEELPVSSKKRRLDE